MFFQAQGLTRRYGGKPVLKDVSFTMHKGEVVSIIGPSGAGKTTLLELIAGMERPDEGVCRFETPPSRENPVILVFQDYVLFPNMTVYDNVAFGLRARFLGRHAVRSKVMDVLNYFGLADMAERYPNELSGGQRQRVAIGRGLVVNPMMLLLDEPFANLDRSLKLQTAEFIRETQKNFGVTTISVTHDLEEAFVMSDRIGLIMDGELVQFGSAQDIYFNPVHDEAARFLGPLNVFAEETLARIGHGSHGAVHSLSVRPEAVKLFADEHGPGIVRDVVFAGHFTRYRVRVGDVDVIVYADSPGLQPGVRVRVEIVQELCEGEAV